MLFRSSPSPAKHFTGICFTLHGRSNAAFSFFFISFICYSFSGPPSNPDILPETLRNIFRAILHIIHKIHIGYLFQLTGHPCKSHIPSAIRITLSACFPHVNTQCPVAVPGDAFHFHIIPYADGKCKADEQPPEDFSQRLYR